MSLTYDRSTEDLGNIVNLGHVNWSVPDQGLATTFYVTGLGLTRDPVLTTGTGNMWINVGDSQFHLPTGAPVVAAGVVVGLVMPDMDALRERLARVRKDFAETRFGFSETNDAIEVTCPWGNRIRCHAPDRERFGAVRLGMAYVTCAVGEGRAESIGAFYRTVMGAAVEMKSGEARVQVGERQYLRFVETVDAPEPCREHHVQIYLANFSQPYESLARAGVKVADSSQHQYRFMDIVDPRSGEKIFALDHEVRSMRHPMYARPLINRDASLTTAHYSAGHDQFNWRM